MRISSGQMKFVRSLSYKKYRIKNRAFVVEGHRILSDLIRQGEIHSSNVKLIASTKDWLDENYLLVKRFAPATVEVGTQEMKKLSSMMNHAEVLAVVEMPQYIFSKKVLKDDLALVFDTIRDPGNLGTIIRTADWHGIKNIICSFDSVDAFNNKVVQASMGAVIRIRIYNESLPLVFGMAREEKIPVYAAEMNGEDLFSTELKVPSVIVFGNEATGIKKEYDSFFDQRICIPSFRGSGRTVESLNVASSAAIICSEFRRRQLQGYSK